MEYRCQKIYEYLKLVTFEMSLQQLLQFAVLLPSRYACTASYHMEQTNLELNYEFFNYIYITVTVSLYNHKCVGLSVRTIHHTNIHIILFVRLLLVICLQILWFIISGIAFSKCCIFQMCCILYFFNALLQCSVSCGSGIQIREVECKNKDGTLSAQCNPQTKPESVQKCTSTHMCYSFVSFLYTIYLPITISIFYKQFFISFFI